MKSNDNSSPNTERDLIQITEGTPAFDGDGVRLTRLIGGSDLPLVDPFLLLDCFSSDDPKDYIRGFPNHPHRGFETVTYMLAGRMHHKDSTGHEDVIGPGDVQWMTAGRGIVHSELPEQSEGLMKGFQLWVNLPAREKMTAPTYRALRDTQIPVELLKHGGSIKVISGTTDAGTVGPIQIETVTPTFFDVSLGMDEVFTQKISTSHLGFIYVIEGHVVAGPQAKELSKGSLGVLGPGDHVFLKSRASDTRLLLVAGRKIGEPIARHGPFVMNTQEEIRQAILDFQAGRF